MTTSSTSSSAGSDHRAIERKFVDKVNELLEERDGPVVVFGISLKGKTTPEKWAIVQKNLVATVACLRKQTDPNYLIVVAGHDKPNLGKFAERVCWLEAEWERPTDPSQYSNDKQKKRRLLLSQLRKTNIDNFYFFTLDADDYLDRDICSYIRTHNNKTGYYIDKGYIYDVSNGSLGTLSLETAPFYRLCGSCAAFWMTRADLPESYMDKTTIWHKLLDHTHFPEAMEELGRPIEPLPFFGGLYFLNHGASNVQEKGTNASKSARALRWRIRSASKVANVLRRFHVRLPEVPAQVDGAPASSSSTADAESGGGDSSGQPSLELS
ncbi:hypothetical protein KHC28_02900 [Ancylobacter sonchi]|uniref:hypothetical protein n=1 Tax=Ancylobacter sonchi TaxID=1937790 RepID=UPI001BD1ECC1|nr:hypothetical protein [Ancylobacter sonchi]MBS7532603.1 hypothetical protein [Ancylobacter sonchi]